MSLTVGANYEVQYTQRAEKKQNDTSSSKPVFGGTVQGSDDKTDIKLTPDRKGWTKEQVVIKEGDSLDKIAYRYGVDPDDFVDQLKKDGKLPADYKRSDVRHKHDISWMKPGKTVSIQYPKSEALKEKYEDFKWERTRYNANKAAKAKKEAAAKQAAAQKPQEPEKNWFEKLFCN